MASKLDLSIDQQFQQLFETTQHYENVAQHLKLKKSRRHFNLSSFMLLNIYIANNTFACDHTGLATIWLLWFHRQL